MYKYKPTSPGMRFRQIVSNDSKKNIRIPFLLRNKRNSGGRNHLGHITSFHRGGGNRSFVYKTDTKSLILDVPYTVLSIDKTPNRSSYTSIILYENGLLSRIITIDGMQIGKRYISSLNSTIDIGCRTMLHNVSVGSTISCIEKRPGSGSIYSRSAGTFGVLVDKSTLYSTIRLSSSTLITVSNNCFVSVGRISKTTHKNIITGKAGISRLLGIRPTVRGVAMNPIDHPHGGGEGKSSSGRPSVSPWGWPTKSKYKTKKSKKKIF